MTAPRILIASLLSLFASIATAQTTAPATQPTTAPTTVPAKPPAPPVVEKPWTGKAYAVVIVGAPGSPMYARHYTDRTSRFVAVLKNAGLDASRITTLSATENPSLSAAEVTKALSGVVATLKPEDQFILVLMGHGAVADNSVTLMLPGPDLGAKAVAAELAKLKCRSQIVLNFSASAGDALALLGSRGRTNIAGSMPGQVNDNDFAEFMLQELEGKSSDLLSAYNRATERYAKWIVRQKKPAEEGQVGWIVEGKESAALFKKLYGDADVSPERKFIASAESEKPDDPNPSVVADGSPAWINRRVVTESPAIDDTGAGAPATAMDAKGLKPVAPGKDSPVGAAAGKTVLGRGN